MLSAGCATPESEVIVEVFLAHPYDADSAGLEKGAKWGGGVCDRTLANGVWGSKKGVWTVVPNKALSLSLQVSQALPRATQAGRGPGTPGTGPGTVPSLTAGSRELIFFLLSSWQHGLLKNGEACDARVVGNARGCRGPVTGPRGSQPLGSKRRPVGRPRVRRLRALAALARWMY